LFGAVIFVPTGIVIIIIIYYTLYKTVVVASFLPNYAEILLLFIRERKEA